MQALGLAGPSRNDNAQRFGSFHAASSAGATTMLANRIAVGAASCRDDGSCSLLREQRDPCAHTQGYDEDDISQLSFRVLRGWLMPLRLQIG